MGLIASHTPFVTGSPHLLLILNKAREESLSLLPGGLVGLAFDGNLKERPLEIRHPALKPLGDPLQITKARGNMILGLEDAPATKELLKRLSDPKAPEVVKKDSASLYVSISVGSPDPKSCNVFRITGGEPSKGVLALNTDRELEPGMWLQFYAPVGAEAQHEIGSGGSLSFSKTSDLLRTFPTEADDIISDATSLHVMSSSGIISGQPRLSGLSDWAPTLVHDDPDASVCLPQ